MSFLVLAAVAAAQQPAAPEINTQLYRPPVDARATLWTEGAGGVVEGFVPAPAVAVHYTNRPLVYLREDGELTVLVSDVLQVDAVFATAFDRFRLAADVPVVLYAAGVDLGTAGMGDIAADLRATILDPADLPTGLAVDARFAFPTGTLPMLADEKAGAELFLAGEQRAGDRVVLVQNLGIRIAPTAALENVDVDDQLVARLGGGYRLGERGGVSADLAARVSLTNASNPASIPTEMLLGGHVRLDDDLVLRLGAGRGLTTGIGSSTLRLVAALALDPLPDRDTDADGLLDAADGCPAEPEDADAWQDDDGCPDLDNDGDGLLDGADGCPDVAEDADSWQDEDGCPDPTSRVAVSARDRGGAAVVARIVVSGPVEDLEGAAPFTVDLHEGVYVARAELVGYVPASTELVVPRDTSVVFTLEPEVGLGELAVSVADEAGVPVPEANWTIDGVPAPRIVGGTALARLPEGRHALTVSAPGTVTAEAEVQIAKDQRATAAFVLRAPRVVVTQERLEVKGTIYFETGKAVIKPESLPLLDEVATNLKAHLEIARVRIEGHTDSRGPASTNLALSEKRAAAVRQYLVDKGVAAERLVSQGFGETRPVDPREVAEAWDKNRRVDFFIEERG